ncbi:MAG TPA: hypothetical protein VMW75_03665 [Thermoanaerobaculia bacterium]|nr:hypothetical protein [Thermoanaerobaculia bacterium]
MVSLSRDAEAVAAPLAARLGRPSRRLAAARELPRFLERCAPLSVLVVASPDQLDFESVTALQGAAIERQCRFGVLSGRDAAALSFAAAKQLLAAGRTSGDCLGFDAVHGRQLMDGIEGPATAAGVRQLVTRDALVLLLMAHGEGSHLLLNEAVLCGLVGRTDTFRGRPLRGGCRRGHCKRASGAGLPVLQVADLRAVLAGFLSCNSFSLAGQLYPSRASLVAAAAESYPAYVVSNAWSTSFSPSELALLADLARRGVRLGEIVAFLNEARACRQRSDSYVLFGDPLAALHPLPAAVAAFPRVAAANDRPQWLLTRAPGVGRVVEYRVAGRPVSAVFLARRRALARVPVAAGGALERIERDADLRALERRWSHLAPVAAVLEDIQHAVERQMQTGDGEASTAIAALAVLRHQIDGCLGECLAEAAHLRQTRLWRPVVTALDGQLGQALRAWDRTFAALTESHLLSGGVVGDRIYDALHWGYREASSVRAERCLRCQVRLEKITLKHLRGAVSRTVFECPLCGPLVSHRNGGPLLLLGLPAELQRGRPAKLAAVLTSPGGCDAPAEGFLVIEIRDKTKPQPVVRTAFAQPLVEGRIEMSFSIPADAGLDQHSMRAVWIGGLEVAFARRVFTLTPDRRTS